MSDPPDYGLHQNEKISLFFNFSFFGEKWGPKNEKSIYPDFGEFIGYFPRFFKVLVCISIFNYLKSQLEVKLLDTY